MEQGRERKVNATLLNSIGYEYKKQMTTKAQ
jgi:hypothetical protein